MRRAVGVLLAVLAAVALTLGVGAAPAAAHDRLLSSTPADGDVLTEVPAEMVLTFNTSPLDIGAVVVLTAADGTEVSPAPQVVGEQVVLELPPDLSGAYDVAWRVTSSDGHPISGELAFEVEAPPPAPTTDAAPPPGATTQGSDPAESEPPTAEPSDDPTSAATNAPADDVEAAGASDDDGPGPLPWLAAAAALALAALGTWLYRRRGTGT